MMQQLRWLRAPGDTLFAIGAVILVVFVFTSRKPKAEEKREIRVTVTQDAGSVPSIP